jgi:short-subunit dehydrogenase
MPRPLEEATVVITGASSGIGRAAALRLARRGSALALCARSLPALREVAAECEAAGADVLARSVDVGDEIAVETFAAEVERRFGRIDVWVNNAGVIADGDFLESVAAAVSGSPASPGPAQLRREADDDG